MFKLFPMEQILSFLCTQANYYGVFQGHLYSPTAITNWKEQRDYYILTREIWRFFIILSRKIRPFYFLFFMKELSFLKW